MCAATPRFLADGMLGRLCTWLRLLGFDTAYAGRSSEVALLRRADAENRVLLTRNRRLLRRRRLPPHLHVDADDFRAQLVQVVEAFDLDPWANPFRRCSVCNEPLVALDRASAGRCVPPYVHRTQSEFSRCPACGRIYWPATHVERMRAELERMHPHTGGAPGGP
jgi:uncharacterized protein with PIN domain